MGLEKKHTFEEIIQANKASIYRICRIYAVAPMEPADLFQEIVYQIWKSFGSFKGGAQISTWVYRIALNVGMRYKLKLDTYNSKTSRLSAINVEPAVAHSNESEDLRFAALRSCIKTLNPANQSIIILHLEGLAYKEIAEITGLTENHIAVKMKRIRTSLFDCITPKLK